MNTDKSLAEDQLTKHFIIEQRGFAVALPLTEDLLGVYESWGRNTHFSLWMWPMLSTHNLVDDSHINVHMGSINWTECTEIKQTTNNKQISKQINYTFKTKIHLPACNSVVFSVLVLLLWLLSIFYVDVSFDRENEDRGGKKAKFQKLRWLIILELLRITLETKASSSSPLIKEEKICKDPSMT